MGEFSSDRSRVDGRANLCQVCERAKNRLRDYAAERGLAERPARICMRCKNKPTTTRKHHYCDGCRAATEASRRRRHGGKRKPHTRSSTERGYGTEHQKERRRWKPKVDRGSVACARCGRLIMPGALWDLGHDDNDRSVYTGPEHRRCNRATSGRRKSRRW